MNLKEVQDTYFEFEDKKIMLIKEVQAFFLKHGFSPYVWIDKNLYLHIKIKHRRGIPYSKDITAVDPKIIEETMKLIDSDIIWKENVESWDENLIGDNKVLVTTELIFKKRGE